MGRTNPAEAENPGEQRAARRDHSARLQRTSGARNTQKPGKACGRKPQAALSQRHVGQDASRDVDPPPRRGMLRRVKPTSVRGMKQGRGVRWRRNAPGGPTNPGGATNRAGKPGICGLRRSQALKGHEPHGRGRTREAAAARCGQTLKGTKGHERSKPKKLNSHRRQRSTRNASEATLVARP